MKFDSERFQVIYNKINGAIANYTEFRTQMLSLLEDSISVGTDANQEQIITCALSNCSCKKKLRIIPEKKNNTVDYNWAIIHIFQVKNVKICP